MGSSSSDWLGGWALLPAANIRHFTSLSPPATKTTTRLDISHQLTSHILISTSPVRMEYEGSELWKNLRKMQNIFCEIIHLWLFTITPIKFYHDNNLNRICLVDLTITLLYSIRYNTDSTEFTELLFTNDSLIRLTTQSWYSAVGSPLHQSWSVCLLKCPDWGVLLNKSGEPRRPLWTRQRREPPNLGISATLLGAALFWPWWCNHQHGAFQQSRHHWGQFSILSLSLYLLRNCNWGT